VLFGFTGVARIAGEPTGRWIARHIAPVGDDFAAAIRLLEASLNRAFRKPAQAGRLLAVVASGFIYDDDILRPFQAIISNGLDEPYSDSVAGEFAQSSISTVEPGQVLLWQAPMRIPDSKLCEEIDEKRSSRHKATRSNYWVASAP
jgi:hypothetical protein